MNKLRKICLSASIAALIVGCGAGSNTNPTLGANTYYSAAYDTYYQIESSTNGGTPTYTFSATTSNGDYLNQIPLTTNGTNNYSFQTTVSGNAATGNISINNGQLGFAINYGSGAYADFASNNPSNQSIPNGTYTTLCDITNLSACTVTINNNAITVTEYNTSGSSVNLCTTASMTQTTSNYINPYLWGFSCGTQGGNGPTGIWYAMPFAANGVTGIMIAEFNPNLNSNDLGTDEVAFIQPADQNGVTPLGNYNYAYQGWTSGQVGISSGSFSSGFLTNPTLGGTCTLVYGQFYNYRMNGFDTCTFSGSGSTNFYNIVGNNTMNIYMDSFSGFYF